MELLSSARFERGIVHIGAPRRSGRAPNRYTGVMSTEWSEDIAIAELSDEPAFSEELGAIIDRIADSGGRVPHVVLNLSSVTYLNSSNIAQLLKLRQDLAKEGRRLKLCSVADDVWSVMMVTGLDKVFQFAPDPMTALAGLQLEDADGSGAGGG